MRVFAERGLRHYIVIYHHQRIHQLSDMLGAKALRLKALSDPEFNPIQGLGCASYLLLYGAS